VITGIGQVHISVTDLDVAVGFYHGKLGLPLLFTVPEQSMAFLQCGATRLYLGRPESPEFHSSPLLYFDVDDIHAAYDRLRADGVEFLGEPHVVHRTETSELWVAFTRDPDGTHLALMQERVTEPAPSP
jgi:catechol 2,3-dioxygenase-like lactoylglutathione lyase family enzyme